MKALVVEDSPTTRTMLVQVLSRRGYTVQAHADADAAWLACQAETFPLAVLDWLLPGRDGLELCRRIRQLPGGDRSIILVLTARDQPGDLAAVLAAGADD